MVLIRWNPSKSKIMALSNSSLSDASAASSHLFCLSPFKSYSGHPCNWCSVAFDTPSLIWKICHKCVNLSQVSLLQLKSIQIPQCNASLGDVSECLQFSRLLSSGARAATGLSITLKYSLLRLSWFSHCYS